MPWNKQINSTNDNQIQFSQKFQPSPLNPKKTINVERTFALPSDNLPNHKFTDQVNRNMLNWDRESFYTLLQDSALSPKMSRANPQIPQVKHVDWSPKGLVQPNKCLCSIVTTAGAIEIGIRLGKKWYTFLDVCEIWHDFQDSSCDLDEFQSYVRVAKKLVAVTSTWSKLIKTYDDVNDKWQVCAYVAIAYRSGDIAVWKVDQIPELSLAKMEQPTLVGSFSTGSDVAISSTSWVSVTEHEFLIFVGYRDGRVQCLNVESDCKGKLRLAKGEKLYLEADGITIKSFVPLKRDASCVDLLVVKHVALVFMRFSNEGKLLQHVFSSITGFPISGKFGENDGKYECFIATGLVVNLHFNGIVFSSLIYNFYILTNMI